MLAGVLVIAIATYNTIEGFRKHLSARVVLSSMADVLVGGVFTLLYYTYFTVVRRALEIFACTKNKEGVWSLDADPSLQVRVSALDVS